MWQIEVLVRLRSWKFKKKFNILLFGVMQHLSVLVAVNSLRPSDAYMRQQTRPPLVQILACHLFSAKPLPEPVMTYFQLDPWEQISVNFIEITTFLLTKLHLKMLSPKVTAILSQRQCVNCWSVVISHKCSSVILLFNQRQQIRSHWWSLRLEKKIMPQFLISFVPANGLVFLGARTITIPSQGTSWGPRSPAIWVFAQQFVQANIKETPTLRVTGLLLGKSTGDQWIPLTKGQ